MENQVAAVFGGLLEWLCKKGLSEEVILSEVRSKRGGMNHHLYLQMVFRQL